MGSQSCAHRGHRVHSGSKGSLGCTKGSPGSIGFAWIPSDAPRDRPEHSGARGFTRAHIGVTAFIRFRVGLLSRARLIYSISHGFTLRRIGVA